MSSKVSVGRLRFKGEKKRAKPSSRNTDTEKSVESTEEAETGPNASNDVDLTPKQGTGRITSSGTTIHGHFTKFMDELKSGDALIITHPTSLTEEMKIVRMVLSNISLSISSAYSTDLVSTTSFRYISVPKEEDENKEEAIVKKRRKDAETEVSAFGTYASDGGEKFVYREKKSGSAYGGYKIITQKIDKASSREELLDMRTKKKSDRYCY